MALGDTIYLIPVKLRQLYKIKSKHNSQQKSMQLQWVEGKAMPKWNVKWNNNLMSKNSRLIAVVSLPCSSGEDTGCNMRQEE